MSKNAKHVLSEATKRFNSLPDNTTVLKADDAWDNWDNWSDVDEWTNLSMPWPN